MRQALFQPGGIGRVEMKNRIIYSSMLLRSSDGKGHFSDAAVQSLLMRAEHGAGLITVPALSAARPQTPLTVFPLPLRKIHLFPI